MHFMFRDKIMIIPAVFHNSRTDRGSCLGENPTINTPKIKVQFTVHQEYYSLERTMGQVSF